MACCFACILQSGGGGGLSAQIGALQQSWRANAPADFARVKFCAGAVAVRYAHLAATAINMRTGGRKCAFVGLSECRGRALYYLYASLIVNIVMIIFIAPRPRTTRDHGGAWRASPHDIRYDDSAAAVSPD